MQTRVEGGGGRVGGLNWLVALVPARGERTWTLTATGSSLDALLPADPAPRAIEVVAAFSERQHDELPPWHPVHDPELRPPIVLREDVLVRSAPVRLRRGADGWVPE
ncbi:MAG TPA: hypothetical protein VHF22_14410 [Planctomycetota bacterium]|nr:hypothetical protein [Planctomycetota bacterium]